MENVLVTGGAGYIGAHACKALARAGFRPIAFDNLSRGHREAVRFGPLIEGDLLDPAAIARAIAEVRPIAVMHFAALTYVGESMTDPAAYYRTNVAGTLELLEAMRNTSVKYIVFSSTAATYGIPECQPIPETASQDPINPYGRSKLMIERILADYRAAYGLTSVALRYFNAAGADPDGDVGEHHQPETHLIPLALDALLELRPPLTLFGTDYDTPDGTCIRDYIHVCDLADAHVKALSIMRSRAIAPAYNLGTGTGISNAQMLATVHRVTDRPVPVVHGPRRPGDPPTLVADARKAQAELDWAPRLSSPDTIVRHAWAWQQKLRQVPG